MVLSKVPYLKLYGHPLSDKMISIWPLWLLCPSQRRQLSFFKTTTKIESVVLEGFRNSTNGVHHHHYNYLNIILFSWLGEKFWIFSCFMCPDLQIYTRFEFIRSTCRQLNIIFLPFLAIILTVNTTHYPSTSYTACSRMLSSKAKYVKWDTAR